MKMKEVIKYLYNIKIYTYPKSVMMIKKKNITMNGVCYLATIAWLILGLCPASERRCYKVTPSLIGWAQTSNQPWIAGATLLVPCHVVKSLQFIWRSGTCRWNPQVPDLQMSCRDLTLWQGTRMIVPVKATRVTYPIDATNYTLLYGYDMGQSATWTSCRRLILCQDMSSWFK